MRYFVAAQRAPEIQCFARKLEMMHPGVDTEPSEQLAYGAIGADLAASLVARVADVRTAFDGDEDRTAAVVDRTRRATDLFAAFSEAWHDCCPRNLAVGLQH